jgi:hypothetical protein
MKSAHSFGEIYKNLKINLSKLGCVMLDLAPPKFILDEQLWTTINGADCIWHYSKNKSRFWIKGFVGEKPHCTALYGLMKPAKNWKKHIDLLLSDVSLPRYLEIDRIGYFDSPYEDDKYWCIVAHLKENLNLLGVNERLQMLPHVRTFDGFKAHVTIAYLSKSQGEKQRDELIKSLENGRGTEAFYVLGLNYGGNH